MISKILHVGLSNNPGGVETLIKNYYLNINKDKFVFDFVDIYGDGLAFEDIYTNLNSKIHILPNYKKRLFKFSKEYIKLVKENNYDVIHIHMQSAANILVVLLSLFSKKSVVVCHSHSTSTPKGIVRKILNSTNKYFLRKLKIEKWACGQKAGIWMWGNKFNSDNIVYNAINYEDYKYSQEKRDKIRSELNILEDTIVLGFVGRFGDEKNVFFLIDILKGLKNSERDYKLLTIGGNGLKEDFLYKIKELNLQNKYIDLGILTDTSAYYNVMDVFLLPSFFEGVPVVAVESQTNGLISILSANISKEIEISNRVEFIDIDNSEEWIKYIENIDNNYNREVETDYKFKLDYATRELEIKYKKIIN